MAPSGEISARGTSFASPGPQETAKRNRRRGQQPGPTGDGEPTRGGRRLPSVVVTASVVSSNFPTDRCGHYGRVPPPQRR